MKKEITILDPKEYLKLRGLKNPPLDSGISGGGDNPRIYVSDIMLEFAKQYHRHRLLAPQQQSLDKL